MFGKHSQEESENSDVLQKQFQLLETNQKLLEKLSALTDGNMISKEFKFLQSEEHSKKSQLEEQFGLINQFKKYSTETHTKWFLISKLLTKELLLLFGQLEQNLEESNNTKLF